MENVTSTIIDHLLNEGDSEIYVKRFPSGDIYTCKCPGCSTLHGAFESYHEAKTNPKCKRCHLKEIEKYKKEIENVDKPEKKRNLFKQGARKPSVIGEADGFDGGEDYNIDSLLGDTAYDAHDLGLVTKEICMAARYGQEFYLRPDYSRDGKCKRVRVSGKCKTWKTRPDEYQLPVKFGLYESLYIDHRNSREFSTVELDSKGRPL